MRSFSISRFLIFMPVLVFLLLSMCTGNKATSSQEIESQYWNHQFAQQQQAIESVLNDHAELLWLYAWGAGSQLNALQMTEGLKSSRKWNFALGVLRDKKMVAWTGSQLFYSERFNAKNWVLSRDSVFSKIYYVRAGANTHEVLAQFSMRGKFISPWQKENAAGSAHLLPVKSLEGQSVAYPMDSSIPADKGLIWFYFGLYWLAYICLYLGVTRILTTEGSRLPIWKIISLLCVVVLTRLLDIWLHAGYSIDQDLRSMHLTSKPFLSMSYGNLILLILFYFIFMEYFLHRVRWMIGVGKSTYGRYKIGAICYTINFMGLVLLLVFCRELVVNSGIDFDFNNVISLGIIPFISIGLLSVVLIRFFLFSYRINQIIQQFKLDFKEKIAGVLFASLLLIPLLILSGVKLPFYITLLIFLLFALVFDIFIEIKAPTLGWVVIWIIFFSAFSAVTLFKFNRDRETDEKFKVADQLSQKNDSLLMQTMDDVILQMKNNRQYYPQIDAAIIAGRFEVINDLFRVILTKHAYLTDYYNFELVIRPNEQQWMGEARSREVLSGELNANWEKQKHYLYRSAKSVFHGGWFKFYWTSGEIKPLPEFFVLARKKRFIPFSSTMDNARGYQEISNINKYDYGIYVNGILQESQGRIYPDQFDPSHILQGQSTQEISSRDRLEVVRQGEGNVTIVVGKELLGLIKPISLFSFLFVLILIIILFLTAINSVMRILPESLPVYFSKTINLRQRIEYSIILVIVFSFAAIAYVTSIYFQDLSLKMEQKQISEKSFALVSDIEHRMDGQSLDSLTVSLLMDLRRSHQTDFSIFSLGGDRIFSTQSNSVVSEEKMDPAAYLKLAYAGGSFYFEMPEKKSAVDKAFMPLRNSELQKVAWMEMPVASSFDKNFFAAFDFLGTLLNVYVFLLLMAGAIAIVIANSITKPLVKLVENLKQIKLGKKNETLEWTKSDEIGTLIKEYNNMINKLEESANLLAKSEREGAWREMARQVAHEIKNPLTPMKLSAQYLIRRVEGKTDPEVEESIRNTSNTLIEQIDNLAAIATEFSNFAIMPAPVMEYINLNTLVASVYDLFRKQDEANMNLFEPIDDLIILADRSHLMRLMNNLLKNAIQSIPDGRKGKIEVILDSVDDRAVIKIKDNGIGIETDMVERVFYPNFTTKSSGMGLGLALCKSIVETFHGKIYFKSVAGEGTEFIVELPLSYTEEQADIESV